MKCPSCAAEASGKFCNNCGAALTGAACASCQANLTPGARFCHVCGTPVVGARRQSGGMVPWLIAGAAVVTLIVIAIARLAPTAPAPGAGAAPAPLVDQGAAPSGMAAPDISNMSPRERADRLFDRIMTLAEQGDTARMKFFQPMAIQAYAMLGAPDDHIRYDVGMIYAVVGRADSALAEATAIEQHTPTDLLSIVVRVAVANGKKDQPTLKRLYRTYLDRYDAEMAAKRPGYEEHRTALQALRDEARRALNVGGAGRGS